MSNYIYHGPRGMLPASQLQAMSYEQQLAYLAYKVAELEASGGGGGSDLDPVEATEDMTQPVGVRDSKLWTKPAEGGNAGVATFTGGTLSGTSPYLTLTVDQSGVPDGAIIDKVVTLCKIAGGTIPYEIELIHDASQTNKWFSYTPMNSSSGYTEWSRYDYGTGPYYLSMSNTLIPELGTVTVSGGFIYYHTEA